MSATTISDERVAELAARFTGRLLRPGEAGYDEARRIHNGLIDKRPAIIARCRGTADVAEAVLLGRESGLEVSVRGGGHNVAGRAVTEGGLMIDLAEMRGIHVDPEARTLRAQGGVLWAELNREAAIHGLATTGGAISTTGIAGLTLGGGLGWLMAAYGLAADNLVEVELVTADGAILSVSDDSHPDLMWALRGGGGNFGVAASLEYRLHPLTTVVGGLIAHPLDAARDVLRFAAEAADAASDELSVFGALAHAPDGSGTKLAAMIVCHTGDPETAERDLAPLKAFGSPLVVDVGPMPYPVLNTILDAGFPVGALNYWRSSFTTRAERRPDRGRRAALRGEPLADVRDRLRALPRRRDARRRHRHGRAAPREGLEPGPDGGVDGPGRTRRRTSPGRGTATRPSRSTSRAGAGSTTSPTTRGATRSGRRTARTTTASSRSSAATTRGTSSA